MNEAISTPSYINYAMFKEEIGRTMEIEKEFIVNSSIKVIYQLDASVERPDPHSQGQTPKMGCLNTTSRATRISTTNQRLLPGISGTQSLISIHLHCCLTVAP